MRHALALVVALLMLGCHSGSQTNAGSASSSPQATAHDDAAATEQAINRLLDEYDNALLKRDYAALERIWADDLTFVNPRGELLTKAQRLENLRTGKTALKASSLEERRIRSYGSAAVATFRVKLEAQYGGVESSGAYRVTTAWANTGGQWQMVAVHMTRIGG